MKAYYEDGKIIFSVRFRSIYSYFVSISVIYIHSLPIVLFILCILNTYTILRLNKKVKELRVHVFYFVLSKFQPIVDEKYYAERRWTIASCVSKKTHISLPVIYFLNLSL